MNRPAAHFEGSHMSMSDDSQLKNRPRSFVVGVACASALTCLAFFAIGYLNGPGPRSSSHPTALRNNCIANLRSIDSAVQQWALESRRMATNTYSLSDPAILSYMTDSHLPVCRSGGRYSPASSVQDFPCVAIHGIRSSRNRLSLRVCQHLSARCFEPRTSASAPEMTFAHE